MTTFVSSPDSTVVYENGAQNACQASSAVAWPAIIAGAAAAAVVTLGLGILGSSLGLAISSPWADDGASAKTIAIGAVIWMIITQWLSSALGGYLAGRLRTRWNYTHNDEVFFRDTAHGFLTWSLATLVTIGFLSGAVSSMIGTGVHAAAKVGAGAAAAPMHGPRDMHGPMDVDYFIDTALRSEAAGAPVSERDSRMEISRIVMQDVKNGSLSADDKSYLTRLVSRRANVSNDEASRRVDNLLNQIDTAKAKVKEAADKARKATASLAIFTFLSMLVGAFIASVAAAIGGRERDYIG